MYTNTHELQIAVESAYFLEVTLLFLPFLAQVEMDLKKHLLISNYFFPLLSKNLATQTCAWSQVKKSPPGQHGKSTGEKSCECKEERITQSNFYFTSIPPTADLP